MRKKSNLNYEDLNKFYVKDKDEANKKINEIKSIELGDLIRLTFKFSIPTKMIGIVKKVNEEYIIIYTNLSNEFYLDKNILINSLQEFMKLNIWIEILNRNPEQ